jgi:hypothetical protein
MQRTRTISWKPSNIRKFRSSIGHQAVDTDQTDSQLPSNASNKSSKDMASSSPPKETLSTSRQDSHNETSTSRTSEHPSSTEELAKEAWGMLNNEEKPMTLRSLLGETNFLAIREKLGENKLMQISGVDNAFMLNQIKPCHVSGNLKSRLIGRWMIHNSPTSETSFVADVPLIMTLSSRHVTFYMFTVLCLF